MPVAVAGLLFTGGASRRLGRDKALVEVDGRTLAERSAALLVEVCAPVIEVGPGYSTLPAVREDPPGSGPLTALVAGWRELQAGGHHGPVLALAVDMPRVNPALLRHLVARPGPATAVPLSDGHWQPLCARWGPEALDRAVELVRTGEQRLFALADLVQIGYILEPEWAPLAGANAFDDVDTPDDLARLLEDRSWSPERHDGGRGT